MYHDNDALLYAVAKLGEHDVILSARETEMYDEYLGYAKNGDKELSIDVDSAENEPYSIVYGGLMFADGTFDDIKDTVESLKGNALLDLDRDKDELAASCYDDIAFFPEHKRADNCIPFAALMHCNNVSLLREPLCLGVHGESEVPACLQKESRGGRERHA